MIYRAHFEALHRVLQDAISPADLLTPWPLRTRPCSCLSTATALSRAASLLCHGLCQPTLHCWDSAIPVFSDSTRGIDSLGPSKLQRDFSMSFLDDTIEY